MLNNLYILVGPSGVGKTTIAEHLYSMFGLTQVQSYTNRPRRYIGEQGHFFVSTEDLQSLKPLINHTVYDGYEYGTTKEIIETSDLYVTDVPGVRYMKNVYRGRRGIKVIGITAPRNLLESRMRNRGDAESVIESRMAIEEDFTSVCDITISNEGYVSTAVLQIIEYICKEEGQLPLFWKAGERVWYSYP